MDIQLGHVAAADIVFYGSTVAAVGEIGEFAEIIDLRFVALDWARIFALNGFCGTPPASILIYGVPIFYIYKIRSADGTEQTASRKILHLLGRHGRLSSSRRFQRPHRESSHLSAGGTGARQ